MKKRKEHIDQLVAETLESASRFKPYQGNPFLFTRIETELNHKPVSGFAGLTRRFAFQWRFTVAVLLIVLNIGTLWFFLDANKKSTENYELQILASEYVVYTGECDLSY